VRVVLVLRRSYVDSAPVVSALLQKERSVGRCVGRFHFRFHFGKICRQELSCAALRVICYSQRLRRTLVKRVGYMTLKCLGGSELIFNFFNCCFSFLNKLRHLPYRPAAFTLQLPTTSAAGIPQVNNHHFSQQCPCLISRSQDTCGRRSTRGSTSAPSQSLETACSQTPSGDQEILFSQLTMLLFVVLFLV